MYRLWNKVASISPEMKRKAVFTYFLTEETLSHFEEKRGKGRNDWPISYMFEYLIATRLGIPFSERAPSSPAVSRFFASLSLDKPLSSLLYQLQERLPNFATIVAVRSIRRGKWNVQYLLDAIYGIPLIAIVGTPSSLLEDALLLFSNITRCAPGILSLTKYVLADEKYDNCVFIESLWDSYRLSPIIPLAQTQKIDRCSLQNQSEVYYDSNAHVFCVCSIEKQLRDMVCVGFEKKTNTHRYFCVLAAYDICPSLHKTCTGKKGVRIPLKIDRRLFTPIARGSARFKKLSRQAIEVDGERCLHAMIPQKNAQKKERVQQEYTLSICALFSLILENDYQVLPKPIPITRGLT